jgi:hypothetical protein
MRQLLAFLVLALPVSASAQSARHYHPAYSPFHITVGACPRVPPAIIGGTQGYSDSMGSGKCFVSIDPTETNQLIYKAFTFFDDGLMMVFSSYGDGEDSNPNLTSAREFWFFPRSTPLTLRMDKSAGTVSVTMSDGGTVTIDPATAQPKSLDRGTVTVSPRVDPAERGGIEITSYAGLVLDGGFRMGESPTGRPAADSNFRDAQGHLCTVKNNELFSYANGDHSFKFTDAQLSAWLRTRCPNLTPGF